MVLSIRQPLDQMAVGIDVNMGGIEHEPGDVAGDGKPWRHARGEFCIADANAGEADAAEIVDALDRGRPAARRGRRDVDEFRPHADLDLGTRRQHARNCGCSPMTWPSMRASCPLTSAGDDVHAAASR